MAERGGVDKAAKKRFSGSKGCATEAAGTVTKLGKPAGVVVMWSAYDD